MGTLTTQDGSSGRVRRRMVVVVERVVAVGLLTQRDLDVLGQEFTRLWPVDETPCFNDLLKAIDEADEELRRSASKARPR